MGKKGAKVILEKDFQKAFIRQIKIILPNSIAIKNDANYLQGFPDWTVIDGPRVYVFEAKAFKNANRQPNQEYYINTINNAGGFARFVYPENMQEVLDEIQRS